METGGRAAATEADFKRFSLGRDGKKQSSNSSSRAWGPGDGGGTTKERGRGFGEAARGSSHLGEGLTYEKGNLCVNIHPFLNRERGFGEAARGVTSLSLLREGARKSPTEVTPFHLGERGRGRESPTVNIRTQMVVEDTGERGGAGGGLSPRTLERETVAAQSVTGEAIWSNKVVKHAHGAYS